MTGHQLIAALESLSATELDMNVYVFVDGQPWPITDETLFIQFDPPTLPSEGSQ